MDSSAPWKSRLSAPQLQGQLARLTGRTRLRRLKNTLLSQGAWQQVTRIEDLCHMHVSHKWLYHLDACAGRVLTPHDHVTNVQKRLSNGVWTGFGQCRSYGSFLDPQLEHGETCSTAEATRGHCACVHPFLGGLKLADQGIDQGITTEPRGLTATQSRPADIFTIAAVPGRSAALDVCVASSNAAAARGDAAQAAFDRRRSHYGNEISELRDQGIHYRPLIWTADGRPHPAVTRTLQHAADIASSRNGQQMSAKSLQRRRTHEIQITLLRRRAAMTRADLPNSSVWAEWLLAGTRERALHRWGHVTPLHGGPRDHDCADCETDTAIPDDDDDIASLNRSHLCNHQAFRCLVLPSRGSLLPHCDDFSR